MKICKDLSIDKIKYLYNKNQKGIDISLYKEDRQIVMFCLHKGSPAYEDDKKEYYWHLNN